MRKIHALILIAFAPLFALTTILGAAERTLPEGKDWRQEAREAYWIGQQRGLTSEATRLIQEQLIPQAVPIVIKNGTDGALEIIFTDIKTNRRIASLKLSPMIKSGTERKEDEKTLYLPLSSVRATVYFTIKRNGKIAPRNFGSFELTVQELKEIKSIDINCIYAIFHYGDYAPGIRYGEKYFTDVSFAEMPSGSEQ